MHDAVSRPLADFSRYWPLAALSDEDVIIGLDHLRMAVLQRRQEMAPIPHAISLDVSRGTVIGLRHVPGEPLSISIVRDGADIEVDPDWLMRLTWADGEDHFDAASMLMEARSSPRRFCALLGVELRGFAATVSSLTGWLDDGTLAMHPEYPRAREVRRAIDSHFGAGRVLHFSRR